MWFTCGLGEAMPQGAPYDPSMLWVLLATLLPRLSIPICPDLEGKSVASLLSTISSEAEGQGRPIKAYDQAALNGPSCPNRPRA